MTASRYDRFPVGRGITLAELEADPYPAFARLREHEPISWVPALGMWYVTRYEDVRAALLDTTRLTTSSDQSTIFDTFGAHMLTTEDPTHDRYRRATQYAFAPGYIRTHFETAIAQVAASLLEEFVHAREADLRTVFAARLPIRVILLVCGLPASAEARMRRWYDSFEAALANFTRDPAIRAIARRSVQEFHELLDDAIGAARGSASDTLISRLANAPREQRLSDEEIRRNLSIIFFGGISTVEALLLNCLWALFEHPQAEAQVRQDRTVLPAVIEETMRWLSPVQSATRHVVEPFEWQGVRLEAHDIVNCMLGAANRDPRVFADPDRFDIGRLNTRRHLGFATGPHACLGSHLAKTEVRLGLDLLLRRLPGLRLQRSLSESPSGYEFRQSRRLSVAWDA
ncbi:MAG TPA: cytochrome P450 [Steroidobacteraceae bacterium]|nr:cytochrome P450 [Steroidobacteraceae bacterium]